MPSPNRLKPSSPLRSPNPPGPPPPKFHTRLRDPHHPLPNRDLDTGFVVKPGGYSLTNSTYANLLHRLTRTPAQPIPPGIKQDIQIYYADPDAPITTKKDPSAWAQVQADLATLATMPTSTEPEPYPPTETMRTAPIAPFQRSFGGHRKPAHPSR